jgi:uncharacterized protein (DUF924 family)
VTRGGSGYDAFAMSVDARNSANAAPADLIRFWHEAGRARRFGRFPHRNAMLGRDSTAEEVAFLEVGGFAG